MAVVTTLDFSGRTEEAINFYRECLGAEVLFMMRFRESPDQSYTKPGMEEKIFHATLRVEGTELMASDVGDSDPEHGAQFAGFALALRVQSMERAQQAFDGLSRDGEVVLPLAKAAFTTAYGIVKDRFGITWKIVVSDEEDEAARD